MGAISSGVVAPHPDFLKLAGTWRTNQSRQFRKLVWQGYDRMLQDSPTVNLSDLERSITQLLVPRIRKFMTGDEPFGIEHGPYEYETKKAPPAQPPQYDMAFILNYDERIMWPLEAKVLETDGAIADYVADIRDQFLTCRYAPFSSEGAMLGYLLSGAPEQAFQNIAKKLPSTLENYSKASPRPEKYSRHVRSVPPGKKYPSEFVCHHLMLEFPKLKRGSSIAAKNV